MAQSDWTTALDRVATGVPWGWLFDAEYSCKNNPHTFSLGGSRERLVLRYEDGHEAEYVVITNEHAEMRLAMVDEERVDDEGNLVEWYLRIIDDHTYVWRRADWPPTETTGYNVSCDPSHGTWALNPTVPLLRSESEIESAAHELVEEIEIFGAAAIFRRLHPPHFAARVVEGHDLGVAVQRELRTTFDWEEFIASTLGMLDTYDVAFVRLLEIEGDLAAVFRATTSEQTTYFFVLFAENPRDQGALIVDWGVPPYGRFISGAMRSSLHLFNRAEAGDERSLKQLTALQTMRQEPRSGWDILGNSPDADYLTPLVLSARLHAAQALSEFELGLATEQLLAHDPDNHWNSLTAFDHLVYTGDIERALSLIQVTEQFVGDPYLATFRVQLLVEADRWTEALEVAEQLVADNPESVYAHGALIDVLLARGEYERVLEQMSRAEAEAGADWDLGMIESMDDFAPLILTEAYREWRRGRR